MDGEGLFTWKDGRYFYQILKNLENIRDLMQMIKNMDLENFNGQMVEYIRVIGRMVDNMVEVYIEVVIIKREKENGKMEEKSDGQMKFDYREKFFFDNINLLNMLIYKKATPEGINKNYHKKS